MKLQRLELVGFKSFAQKTSLKFLPGIVGIVGPNGAGKSNITDAIRWVLGERESSHLRSAKIEDLIFAGTPKRPAMSLAQVSIHFDNSAGVIPLDFTDIVVSRRVSRAGNSEYYLNEARVRLKDIIDLFAKARLGVRGIAVINQGASDVFLRAKPDERREMIEEMLGLKEYRLKRNDADNKLKNTEVNLQKAEALVVEIQPHLRFLKRQKGRWDKRQDIETLLRNLEKDYFLRQLKRIVDVGGKSHERRAKLEEELESASRELSARKKKLEATEGNQPELLEKMNQLRQNRSDMDAKKSELSRELGKLEGRFEAAVEVVVLNQPVDFDLGEAKQFIARVRERVKQISAIDSLEEVRGFTARLAQDIDLFLIGSKRENVARTSDVKIQEIQNQKEELVSTISEFNESLAVIVREQEMLSAEANETNKAFQEVYRLVDEQNERVKSLESAINSASLDDERASVHLEDLKTRIREAQWEYSVLEESLTAYQFQDFDFDVEAKIFKLRRELAAIGDIDEQTLEEARETEERNSFLTTQIEDLRKAKDDLTGLIGTLDKQIHDIFAKSLRAINNEFQNFFKTMFGGGRARLVLDTRAKKKRKSALEMIGSEIGSADGDGEVEEEKVDESEAGIDILVDLPRKKIKGVEMLSGGERSLVSIAALFALVSVSPPPFLVLDEVDAALDEMNAKRFSNLLKELSKKTQFIVVTHNRVTMEAADALYGVTMGDDGVSQVLSLKLEQATETARE